VDPVTLGAVLLAVGTGVSEALGGQLWAGVVSLIARPWRGKKTAAVETAAVGTGETELRALQASPGDQQKAVALARVLLARAETDAEFENALKQWWQHAEPVRQKIGNVTNTIRGGNFLGPVLQGRDFSDLTFGASGTFPASPSNNPGAANDG
jgi:hypothetical protein